MGKNGDKTVIKVADIYPIIDLLNELAFRLILDIMELSEVVQ